MVKKLEKRMFPSAIFPDWLVDKLGKASFIGCDFLAEIFSANQ